MLTVSDGMLPWTFRLPANGTRLRHYKVTKLPCSAWRRFEQQILAELELDAIQQRRLRLPRVPADVQIPSSNNRNSMPTASSVSNLTRKVGRKQRSLSELQRRFCAFANRQQPYSPPCGPLERAAPQHLHDHTIEDSG